MTQRMFCGARNISTLVVQRVTAHNGYGERILRFRRLVRRSLGEGRLRLEGEGVSKRDGADWGNGDNGELHEGHASTDSGQTKSTKMGNGNNGTDRSSTDFAIRQAHGPEQRRRADYADWGNDNNGNMTCHRGLRGHREQPNWVTTTARTLPRTPSFHTARVSPGEPTTAARENSGHAENGPLARKRLTANSIASPIMRNSNK